MAPQDGDTYKVTIRLDRTLAERAREAARDTRRSLNNWIATVIEHALAERENDPRRPPPT